MEKRVSVIIPVYNAAMYIDACVDSVLTQTYSRIQLILIDDGSTDDSGKHCDAWAKKDARVQVIHSENKGPSVARNAGIDAAAGDYIVFMDSDDYWEGKDSLAQCMAHLEESGADMLVFGYSKWFEADGVIKPATPIGQRSAVLGQTKTAAFDYLTEKNIHAASACSRITKAGIIKDKLYFKPGTTAEDIDWTARLVLAVNRIDYCPKNFYIYRQRAGSTTKTMTKNNIIQLQGVIENCIAYGKKSAGQNFYPSYMGYVAYQYITSLANAYKLNRADLKAVYGTLAEQSWLLEYGENRRVKMIAAAKKLLGFRAMFAVLRVYYKGLKR